MTLPLLVKTRFSMDVDGAFSNDQSYNLTIGTDGSNDISIYQSWYQKIRPPVENEVQSLIDLGYTTTMKYDFTKKEKKSSISIYTIYNILLLAFLWFLKIISLFLKMCNVID